MQGTDYGEGAIVGILFDLGVSSPQLDEPARGFSYWGDAALDMRMDNSQELTAAVVVNTYDEDRLTEIISEYGEERFARAPSPARSSRPGRCRRPRTWSTRSRPRSRPRRAGVEATRRVGRSRPSGWR